MANIPRTVSVKALDDVLLLAIGRESFWEIISQNLELAVLIESIGKVRIKESIQYMVKEPLSDTLGEYSEASMKKVS